MPSPRDKARRVDRSDFPIRLQDGTGLIPATTAALTPIIVEAVQDAAAAAVAADRARDPVELRTLRIMLPYGRSGSIVVADRFAVDQVGAPVMVNLASAGHPNEADLGFVLFTGEIVDRERMRLTWFSLSTVSRDVTIVYLIGRVPSASEGD